MRTILLLGALALVQDEASLLRGLGSEDAAERERAGRAILELGQKARPLLERGTRDPDLEVAGRARDLLAALEGRLESYAHVLGKIRAERADSLHRLLRDAGHALRERCDGREWSEIPGCLQGQGIRLLDKRTSQFGTTWRFLACEGAVVAPAGLRHDLILEMLTQPQTSKTEPTKQVLRQAKAVLLWKGKTDVAAIEAKPYPEGLFRQLFSQPLFRVDLGPYPVLEELEVAYQHLFDRWQERSPWGFLIVARLTNPERSAGKTFLFRVPSGLDPLTDFQGRSAPGEFTPSDTLGEWRPSGASEWRSGKKEPNTLRRVEAKRPTSEAPAPAVALGPGDLKGLPDASTFIALRGEDFRDADCEALVRFAKLKHLSIEETRSISSEGLAVLARLPELETLYLGAGGVEDDALRAVASIPKLKSLDVASCGGLTDAGVAHLSAAKALTRLSLSWGEGLTDKSLRSLSALEGLRSLSLWGAGKLADPGLEHLSKLTGLEELTLSHSASWTPAGLAHLGKLRALRVLTLGYASVDDRTPRTLSQLPLLEEIWLRGLDITDAGLLELKSLTTLRFLHVDDCKKTSPAGLQALRMALPGAYELE